MAKPAEDKIVLEREYVVPLRSGWLKAPKYRRAKKAVKTLKEFLARHMKVYDRDLRKIKVDIDLNNEIRFRGMKKPLNKVKVKAIKYESGIVKVTLAQIPEYLKYKLQKQEKFRQKAQKETKEIKKQEKEEVKEKEETKEETIETKEKEEASKEAGLEEAKQEAIMSKHTSKDKKVVMHRKAMSR
ncbi:MAG: 50S ribosomal protein L31e [Candidatus Nanoarchaeia archaeon]